MWRVRACVCVCARVCGEYDKWPARKRDRVSTKKKQTQKERDYV